MVVEMVGGSTYELSQEERDGLIHMRIEEKLARDVYIVMGELWNHKVFLNIQLSEQKHMEASKKISWTNTVYRIR